MTQTMILVGDVRSQLRNLASESVHCAVTSPPYFGLRSYDENAVIINPKLDAQTRAWLESELLKRGIRAR